MYVWQCSVLAMLVDTRSLLVCWDDGDCVSVWRSAPGGQ